MSTATHSSYFSLSDNRWRSLRAITERRQTGLDVFGFGLGSGEAEEVVIRVGWNLTTVSASTGAFGNKRR